MFPVSLVGPGTRQWWHDFLIFTIYYRPPTHRTVRALVHYYMYIRAEFYAILVMVLGRVSRVAQWERAGPITQRSMDRNHPLLAFSFSFSILLHCFKLCGYTMEVYTEVSRVAQWERAGPITQRSMDRNHPLLAFSFPILLHCFKLCGYTVYLMEVYTEVSRVAQWERAGPITQRSMDRNHPLLAFYF